MHAFLRRFLLAFVLLLQGPLLLGATRGVVVDTHGQPVAGARVTAHRWELPIEARRRVLAALPRSELASATTDERGLFALDTDAAGILELHIERDGFAPREELVLAGEEQVVDLSRAENLTGRVTAQGKPVSKALVIAYVDGSVVWTTRTDASGRYTIPDPKRWTSWLMFVHPDFAPLRREDTAQLDAALQPGATVSGSVVDRSGRPVPRATVFAGQWTTATTTDEGSFALHNVSADEKTIVAIEGASFGLIKRDAKSMVVQLAPGRSVTGTVRDTKERPLAGVPVYGVSSAGGGAVSGINSVAITSDKGVYSLPHIDAADYDVYAYAGSVFDFAPVPVTLRNAMTARADLTADKRELLTGTVVDDKKQPVAGATVQYTVEGMPLVYGVAERREAPIAKTDANGRFRLRWNEAMASSGVALRLQALRGGYAVGVASVPKIIEESVTIVLPSGVELTGVVTDSSGKAVAGAGVTLLQEPTGDVPMPLESVLASGALLPFVETDAAGRFALRVNAVPHDIGVWKAGYVGERLGNITAKADAPPLKIALGKGVEIRGKVTDGKGVALRGRINATGPDLMYATAEVAPDGTFAIDGLRAGSYKLTYAGDDGRTVEQEAKAPVTNVDIALPALTEIRGRVVDSSTGAAIRNYTVEFGAKMLEIVDAETFTLPVPSSEGRLTVSAEGYVRGAKDLVPEGGKPLDVTIALAPGRAVRGVVTDEKGTPINDAWVALGDSDDSMEETAASGEFRLTAPRAAATLEVRAEGYARREIAIAAGEQDLQLDVTLSAGRQVRGHVLTSDGAPVSGATVLASGADSQRAKTDESGAFVLRGLGTGVYQLMASRDELQSEETALGEEIPSDLVLVMKPSRGAGKIHGVVQGFSSGGWMFGMVRSNQGAFAVIGRDGKFVIERAEAGEVELQATAQSTSGDATSAPVKVTVIAGGDVEANLLFRKDVVVRGS